MLKHGKTTVPAPEWRIKVYQVFLMSKLTDLSRAQCGSVGAIELFLLLLLSCGCDNNNNNNYEICDIRA